VSWSMALTFISASTVPIAPPGLAGSGGPTQSMRPNRPIDATGDSDCPLFRIDMGIPRTDSLKHIILIRPIGCLQGIIGVIGMTWPAGSG
jgi:hypothetical protein